MCSFLHYRPPCHSPCPSPCPSASSLTCLRPYSCTNNTNTVKMSGCRQEGNDREKEKRGGEGRRMLASSADMSPLVRFGSVSRQETATGSKTVAKHPRNCRELLLPKTNQVHTSRVRYRGGKAPRPVEGRRRCCFTPNNGRRSSRPSCPPTD